MGGLNRIAHLAGKKRDAQSTTAATQLDRTRSRAITVLVELLTCLSSPEPADVDLLRCWREIAGRASGLARLIMSDGMLRPVTCKLPLNVLTELDDAKESTSPILQAIGIQWSRAASALQSIHKWEDGQNL